jgi:hypothetical protein
MKAMEKGYVNDAIVTAVKCSIPYPPNPMIPPYDAAKDRYAAHYFDSPNVQSFMGRKKVSHVVSRSLKICCCQGQ